MSKKALDPGLASILESIRATVGGEAPASPPARADSEPEAVAAAPTRRAPPPPQQTVEEFLAALIRPQVDAWLAAHLPEIVQKLTAEQIEKLLGKS